MQVVPNPPEKGLILELCEILTRSKSAHLSAMYCLPALRLKCDMQESSTRIYLWICPRGGATVPVDHPPTTVVYRTGRIDRGGEVSLPRVGSMSPSPRTGVVAV